MATIRLYKTQWGWGWILKHYPSGEIIEGCEADDYESKRDAKNAAKWYANLYGIEIVSKKVA